MTILKRLSHFTLIFAAITSAAPWKINIPLATRQTIDPGTDRIGGTDFPDPTLWLDPDTHAVTFAGTSGNGYKIQAATASAFTDASYSYSSVELLSEPASWAMGSYWAPDIGKLVSAIGCSNHVRLG